jgi:hypothetical protein
VKTKYGVPVPRGVQKDWEASPMGLDGAGEYLRSHHAPNYWGDPTRCVAWFDRFGRCRLCVGYYANGRAVTMRKDANGKYSATFHFAPASAGEAQRAETTKIGSVHEHATGEAGDAQC